MTWFRLDDKFHSHPKVIAAGNAAVGLFVRCCAYCADHSTDGRVPLPVARQFGTAGEATRLAKVGLWTRVEGGYQIPDYLEYNFSAAEVKSRREKRSQAGAVGGKQKASKRLANAKQMLDVCQSDATNADVANVYPEPEPVPNPKESSSQSQTGTTTTDHRITEAIGYHAEVSSQGKDNPVGYAAKVRSSAYLEHGPALLEYASKRPDATPEQIAIDVLGTRAPAPVIAQWHADPHCGICGGDGFQNHAPEGEPSMLGPCSCRQTEPYLADVIQIRATG